jgi:hypothetical protein
MPLNHSNLFRDSSDEEMHELKNALALNNDIQLCSNDLERGV